MSEVVTCTNCHKALNFYYHSDVEIVTVTEGEAINTYYQWTCQCCGQRYRKLMPEPIILD